MERSQTELVTEHSHLATVVQRLAKEPGIAVDLESNGFHRYPERVCLVQVGIPGREFIIDPIALGEMPALEGILSDRRIEKVFHSADYDMRSLDRDWGVRVQNLYDTSIAAAFVGVPRLGLGTVVEETLGIELPKSKRLQRADWGLRPLDDKALGYAAGDVRHLLALRRKLGDRLKDLGRVEWVAEECSRLSRVRYVAPDLENAFLSVKDGGALDGRGLAVLRSLFAFREREALRLDRPHFKVLPDSALLELAASPGTEVDGRKGLGPYSRHPGAASLREAIRVGLAGPAVGRPARRRRSGPYLGPAERARAKKRLVRLKEWRTALGKQLEMDPALLWPAVSLERLSREETGLDSELAAPEVRSWQSGEFAGSLRSFLDGDMGATGRTAIE